jgi:hypothetical protein
MDQLHWHGLQYWRMVYTKPKQMNVSFPDSHNICVVTCHQERLQCHDIQINVVTFNVTEWNWVWLLMTCQDSATRKTFHHKCLDFKCYMKISVNIMIILSGNYILVKFISESCVTNILKCGLCYQCNIIGSRATKVLTLSNNESYFHHGCGYIYLILLSYKIKVIGSCSLCATTITCMSQISS